MSDGATHRVTNRWAGADAVAWAAAAVGLFAREPAVLLLAGVGVAFAAYAKLGTPPRPDVEIAREVDDEAPAPGQEVTVRLTVANAGERTLPDVRVVDGVPTALGVADGSPHLGTALRGGESLTNTYVIRAERGTHSFDPVTVVCRSLNGEHETELADDVETTITCRPEMDGSGDPPLRSLVSHRGGQIPTDSGGSGVEFYGVRSYRPGDRASRIDWARRARTGELTTLEFREERAATAVLCVDARSASYVRARDDDAEIHAVERSVRAAAELFAGLLDAGTPVGVAAFGTEFVWLRPGTGDTHRRRAGDVLATHPTLSPSPAHRRVHERTLSTPSPGTSSRTAAQLRRLDARLPADAQVFFLSPLVDDVAVAVARRVQVAGNAVTVVSPDVTRRETPGTRLARLRRRRRIRELYRDDVRVVDWRADEPLAVAFERAREARR